MKAVEESSADPEILPEPTALFTFLSLFGTPISLLSSNCISFEALSVAAQVSGVDNLMVPEDCTLNIPTLEIENVHIGLALTTKGGGGVTLLQLNVS